MKQLVKKVGFHLMRTIRSKKTRDSLTRFQANRIGKMAIPKGIGKPLQLNVNDLKNNGYLDIGQLLTEAEVDNLKSEIEAFKVYDPFRKNLGMFAIEDIPEEVSVANFKREHISALKSVLNIANNSDILEVVQDFLGAKPTISNINMWWSLSSKAEAEQAQLFHRDVDDFKFCKLFIYLTDVTMNSGPHVYVEGSSVSEKLLKIRRYQDSEIEEAFGKEKIKHFVAPKGSSFIVDTYGFHKGLLPKDNDRLLLQIQYSLNPIGVESYNPIHIGTHPYDDYINRLILK